MRTNDENADHARTIILDCRSRNDMRALSGMVLAQPREDAPFLAAQIMSDRLMLSHWWLHLAVRFGAWRNSCPRSFMWLSLFERLPATAYDLILATAEWIVSGKDADGQGVGGFNQREVDRLLSRLSTAAETE